ncbi:MULTISPECIES: nuclear transport factor 2 family protein [unclassified Streptomyces]|uniref:nuclear transport factor 2 family protein n=1 Tax=unclassified Streptomyces TaxID=2593676 RepID=UPI00224E1E04|nr:MULTISPECIES: nuclear transport factor 2 family protein [unclassified Streptomyces]MCX4642030.1 nuclear transport factor 2 family protein [Streptomyces sp. NBC_01446]MCX5326903.1 nuclear transport factor 2 family protein [Streptomyces sp. NBC_00120]
MVTAYFAGVTAADPHAVADLFAPDAVLQNAAGTLTGAEAIRRMYENGLTPGAMKPNPKQFVVDGENIAVEIDLIANGSAVTLGDFFTVRNGKIERLAIYSLSPVDGRLFDKVGVDPDPA